MTEFRPSRRSVTRGAAWAVPAVVVAAGAPAYASTPQPTPVCLQHHGISAPTYTVSAHNWNIFTGKSRVQLNLGSIYGNSDCAPANATGFRFLVTSVIGHDQSDVAHTGSDLGQPSGAPYVLSTGGALWVAATFMDFDYNAPGIDPDWNSSHYLKSYVINYVITYLDGLTEIGTYAGVGTVTANPNATYIGGTLSRIG